MFLCWLSAVCLYLVLKWPNHVNKQLTLAKLLSGKLNNTYQLFVDMMLSHMWQAESWHLSKWELETSWTSFFNYYFKQKNVDIYLHLYFEFMIVVKYQTLKQFFWPYTNAFCIGKCILSDKWLEDVFQASFGHIITCKLYFLADKSKEQF